jgi:hypothetical protein
MTLTRHHDQLTATAATSVDNSTPIYLADFSGGGVSVGTITSATKLTFYVAEKTKGTFRALTDSAGDALEQPVATGEAYSLPDEVFGWGALKIVADNEALTVIVSLKG